MYVVIKIGGKQYKVVVGEKFKVEQILVDIDVEIMFDQVFVVGEGELIKFGMLLVSGVFVKVIVVLYGCYVKVIIFKMCCWKYY